jgi:hypothetical protein
VALRKVTCKVCSSRYKLGSAWKTWRNRDLEIAKCDVCRTVLANWARRGLVPVLTPVWRAWGGYTVPAPAHPRSDSADEQG